MPLTGLVAVLLFVASLASGKTLQVPKKYPTIHAALEVARHGDVIQVGRGTFKGEPLNFQGKRVRLESLYGPEVTILDGQGKSRVINFISGETNQTVISGFTIRNGKVRGDGGGILCSGSSPTIENCVITNNKAYQKNVPGQPWRSASRGGIACIESASPTLIGCTVTRNNATNSGGGLYVHENRSIRIADCAFSRNVASDGGGLFIDPLGTATVEIENCTFTRNRAGSGGGGAKFRGGYLRRMSLRMDRCLFEENTAGLVGGGLCCDAHDAVITNCIIRKNTAQHIYVGAGGLDARGGTFRVEHCTIIDNRAGWEGGAGIRACNHDMTIISSILYGNEIPFGDKPKQIRLTRDDASLDVRYCHVEGGFPGTNNFDGNPRFQDPSQGDCRLKEYSPCIDSADPASAVANDYAGTPRPHNGRTDVGAFESDKPGNTPPQIDAFTANSLVGPPPFKVTFTCQASDDQPELTPDIQDTDGKRELACEMEYGDGKRQKGRAGTFTHTYTELGIYHVTCRAKDRYGALAHATLIIRATNSQIPGGYETIQRAINAASNGDTIALPDGRYEGHGNYDLDFKGKAITLTSVNGPENCIIDGGYQGRLFYFHSNERASSVVSGLTLYDGHESSAAGGAILCEGASPTIENCRIIECSANHTGLGRGGAICCMQNAAPKIKNCYIANNLSGQSGGAIGGWDAGAVRIEDCTIIDNASTNMSGGAIDLVNSASPKILRCLIESNEASRHGGAINLAACGVPEIRDCVIRNNTAGLGGGGICVGGEIPPSSPTKIDNCILTGNEASQSTAPQGAAIESRLCKVDIRNCTVTANKAVAGDGVAIALLNITQATLRNNIVWGATSGDALHVDTTSTLQATFCNIEGGHTGQGNIDANPEFEAPANHDFRLQSDSPCLDTGAATGVPTADIAGTARPQDQGYDMGAYEGAGDLATVGCATTIAPTTTTTTTTPPTATPPTAISPIEALLGRIGFHENWSDFKPGAEAIFEGVIMNADGTVTTERVTVRLTAKDSKGSHLTIETANLEKGRTTNGVKLHVTSPARTKRSRSKGQGNQELKLKGKRTACEVHEIVRRDAKTKTSSSILEWRNAAIPGGLGKIQIRTKGPAGSEGQYELISYRK